MLVTHSTFLKGCADLDVIGQKTRGHKLEKVIGRKDEVGPLLAADCFFHSIFRLSVYLCLELRTSQDCNKQCHSRGYFIHVNILKYANIVH